MNGLHKLPEQPTDIQLYVLEMLRQVVEISEAEQAGSGINAGCYLDETGHAEPRRDTEHDKDGYLALLGYCK